MQLQQGEANAEDERNRNFKGRQSLIQIPSRTPQLHACCDSFVYTYAHAGKTVFSSGIHEYKGKQCCDKATTPQKLSKQESDEAKKGIPA